MPVLTLIRINGQVPWRCFSTASGNWVGICDPLKLTLQAETWSELMEEMGITLDAFLKELFATNDFDRFMRENGWNVIGPIPRREEVEHLRFDLPFVPVVAGSYDTSRGVHQ
jgi:hypothetical protein